MFPEPTMTSLKCLCCLNISQKSKYIQFIIIKDVEMHEIFTFKGLEPKQNNNSPPYYNFPPPFPGVSTGCLRKGKDKISSY